MLVVIGGGAAGMMATIIAARDGLDVMIIEKTSSLGKKLSITGKGRCNVTFRGDIEDLKKNIVSNFKFMYSSFMKFSNEDVMSFFEDLGIKLKVERGNRVFPISDKAQDIVDALKNEIKRLNVKVLYNKKVVNINTVENVEKDIKQVKSVVLDDGTQIECNKVLIATGGKSYPKTGSSGDGYVLAKKIGHSVTKITPGLVPLRSEDITCKNLQGLTLKNISYKLIDVKDNRVIYSDFGEMLFAHFGISGPVVLSSSSSLKNVEDLDSKFKKNQIKAIVDLKPALTIEMLDKRICRDFEKYSNKEFKNSLNDLLPQKMIPEVISRLEIDNTKKVNQITKEERLKLVNVIKEFEINLSGYLPIDIAVVTQGGVDVKEVNPKTMESKKCRGLFFAGEVLDIDAYTGGFNLQIAFSTGYAAAKGCNSA